MHKIQFFLLVNFSSNSFRLFTECIRYPL